MAVIEGAGGSTSFNEANVANDFKEIMEQAEVIQTQLRNTSNDLNSVVGNASMNDAYSGDAAVSIRNQWADLESTFDAFVNNFKNWYDQSVESAKEMAGLQAATRTVNEEQTQ